MVKYLSVKDFEQCQRYKDRLLPWVKLHYSLLEDPAWMALDEVQQCRFMKLLLVASRCENRISTDQLYLQNMLRVRYEVDLTPLIKTGFLVTFRAKHSASHCHNLAPNVGGELELELELERERERELERERDGQRVVPLERTPPPGLKGLPSKKPSTPTPKRESLTTSTWNAYASAYLKRYNIEPLTNAKSNGILSRFLQRVPMDEAPLIAAYYVTHNAQYYVAKLHPLNLLLLDAEKLRTEWATGRQVTNTHARQADGKEARGQMWNELIQEESQKEALV